MIRLLTILLATLPCSLTGCMTGPISSVIHHSDPSQMVPYGGVRLSTNITHELLKSGHPLEATYWVLLDCPTLVLDTVLLPVSLPIWTYRVIVGENPFERKEEHEWAIDYLAAEFLQVDLYRARRSTLGASGLNQFNADSDELQRPPAQLSRIDVWEPTVDHFFFHSPIEY